MLLAEFGLNASATLRGRENHGFDLDRTLSGNTATSARLARTLSGTSAANLPSRDVQAGDDDDDSPADELFGMVCALCKGRSGQSGRWRCSI